MKKTFLITILGLVIIFFPLGNSLLNTNSNSIKVCNAENETGLQILDTSNVQVFDMDKTESVSYLDQPAEINIDLIYDKEINTGYSITKENQFHVYESAETNKEILSFTVEEVYNLGTKISDQDSPVWAFSLNFKYEDRKENGNSNIWNYKIENANGFKVTLDTTFSNQNQESLIGFVEVIDEIVNYPFDYWIITSGEVKNKTPTISTLDYEIMFDKNVINPDGEVKEVKWIDGDDNDKELATTTNKSSGILYADDLDLYKTYQNTYLIAEMNDQNFTNKVKIDPFTTMSQQVSTEIVSTGEPYDLSNNSASLDYQINLGVDHKGEPVEVLNVKWIDQKGNILATDPKNSGTFVAEELNSHTKYNNTKIVAEVSDGNNPQPKEINNFNTKFFINKIIMIDGASILIVLLAWLIIVGFFAF